jgi:hypothetical protein
VSRKYFQGNTGNITAAIWLIGLGILALTDQWWPGILILIGLSMVAKAVIPVAEGVSKTLRPSDNEDDYSYLEEPLSGEVTPAPARVPEAPLQVKVSKTLPSSCPMCGAPVDARKIKHSASGAPSCSYCDAKLAV